MTTLHQLAAAECACRRMRMAARKVTRLYDDALRPLDIKVTQFTLLVAIQRGAPDSISRLADWLAMERTTLTRNLALLEKLGLVRVGPEGARRARGLTLTRKGERMLERALPLWREAQLSLERSLGRGNWKALRDQLDGLIAAI